MSAKWSYAFGGLIPIDPLPERIHDRIGPLTQERLAAEWLLYVWRYTSSSAKILGDLVLEEMQFSILFDCCADARAKVTNLAHIATSGSMLLQSPLFKGPHSQVARSSI